MSAKNAALVAQASVTAILLALLWRSLDVAALRSLFGRLPLWFYALSLGVVLSGQVLYAWRWGRLLAASGVRVPLTILVRQYFIGLFLNNFLPSTVGGDVAKVYLLGRSRGYRLVTASVLVDRILGVGLLALLAAATLWSLALPSPVLGAARLAVTGIAAGSVLLLTVVAAGTGNLAARLTARHPAIEGLTQRLQRLRYDMAAGLTSPLVIGQAGAVVLGYSLAISSVYVLFITVQSGDAPPFPMMLGVVMATAVLSNIPVSLNGLGLREQLHAVLLAPLGIPRETAVAISLLLFAHLLVASLVGLVFWMRTPVRAERHAGAEV